MKKCNTDDLRGNCRLAQVPGIFGLNILFMFFHIGIFIIFTSWNTIEVSSKIVSDTNITIPLTDWQLDAWDMLQISKRKEIVMSMPAKVPNDVISILLENEIIDEPFFENNFLDYRHIWMGSHHILAKNSADVCGFIPDKFGIYDPKLEFRTRIWSYKTEVSVPTWESSPSRSLLEDVAKATLVFESIKSGAYIYFDDNLIGIARDQFSTYSFDLPIYPLFYNKNHTVEVIFDPCIDVLGRYMACSGGWDWAPYSRSGTFSFGLIQDVYLVLTNTISIKYVVPHILYLGEYPMIPLLNGPEGDFLLTTDIHFYSSEYVSNLVVLINAEFLQGNIYHKIGKLQPGNHKETVTLTVQRESVKLWWPHGMGIQHLYMLSISLEGIKHDGSVVKTPSIKKRVGFRTTSLVTTNEFLNETDMSKEGSGSYGMYFRVNGAVVWCRGANVVPMDQLEGRFSDLAHRNMVSSVAAAGMNMIRVWGGGIIFPSSFYDACDEYGILIYHDLMYVEEQGHVPNETQEQDDEIREIVRSLAHHSCLILWSGCNECTDAIGSQDDIYTRFVMAIVAQEDPTRIIWPGSPSSSGWKLGIRTIDSKPNGNKLVKGLPLYSGLEYHGPYWHGCSKTHPSVNGPLRENCTKISTDTPTIFFETSRIGPQYPSKFISEFGATVYSSFESMAASFDYLNFSTHGGTESDECTIIVGNLNKCNGTNVWAERNYPCDSIIESNFHIDKANFYKVGTHSLQRQLYFCMISQALIMKSEIEYQRSQNIFGSLIWQLNENWPTGGWGCLEYGSTTVGQVLGGRWKPIMYFLSQHLFRDVIIACGADNLCYCKNDGILSVKGTIMIEKHSLLSGAYVDSKSFDIDLPGGHNIRKSCLGYNCFQKI